MAVALAEAARTARAAFGERADAQLGATLRIVEATAQSLGISIGEGLKAMLDAHSVSFTGGTIALHGADGVPLRALGTGSTRLLLAGLQRQASQQSTVVLIDELEHGLEPHRIIRLLGSIGAKDAIPPLQAFVTTHSPVAIRELRGDQVFVVRKETDRHTVATVGVDEHTQGTIRLYPEAFLASSVIVCEGASEVGLLRGLDLHRANRGELTVTAAGVAWVDAKGIGQLFARAAAFQALGYGWRSSATMTCSLTPLRRPPSLKTEEPSFAGATVAPWKMSCSVRSQTKQSSSWSSAPSNCSMRRS